jgi:Tol biopolymer transport system component
VELVREGFGRGRAWNRVGHLEDRGHAPEDRRSAAGHEVLFVSETRLAEVHVGIDDPGQDVQAAGFEDNGRGPRRKRAQGDDPTLAYPDVAKTHSRRAHAGPAPDQKIETLRTAPPLCPHRVCDELDIMSRTFGALLVFFFGGNALAAEGQPKRFDLADLGRLVHLADPQIAPDGKSIVLVVSRANEAENRYDAELVAVDLATRTHRILTFERRGLSSPRFSPAGDRLAFLAAGAPPSSVSQVYVMSVTGGDARRVTAAAEGVSRFAWRPDGATLAFIAEDPTPVRTGAARFDDAFEVGNDGYLTTHPPAPSHLWLVSADGGEARRLTTGPWSLATGLGASELSWSPDGREIAFCRTTTASSGDAGTSQVSIIDVTTGEIRSLGGKAGGESDARFSPRGGMLLYTQHKDADPANLTEAYVAPAAGGAGTVATRELDRSIGWTLWMPDGRALLVGGNDGGRVGLWEQPLGGVAHALDLGPIAEYTGLAVGPGGALGLVGSEASRPPELYYLESLDTLPRRLTDFNLEVASRALGKTEA